MARREWPLVVFTLLGQTAAGAFWLAAVPLALSNGSGAEADGPSPGFLVYAGIAALLAVAAAVSFLHLGRPWLAHHALDNLKSSWLSRAPNVLLNVVENSVREGETRFVPTRAAPALS